ncbi:MAG: hypothetical protein VZR54_10365 [Ruminococcus sp.]|nr:hypothetical protein [Ruminococcus sp.]
MPYSSAGKGFARSFRALNANDASDDIFQSALLFSREVSVSLQDIILAFYPDEPVKDICAATGIAGHTRQKDVSYLR